MKLAALLLLFTIGSAVHAQSPREQLLQMVEELRAKPADRALREHIVRLAREVKPPPAIPEGARRHFVQGNTIATAAKSPVEQELAIKAYNEALRIAPWWGDAYYNLAIAQELAGQLDVAERTLKLYLLSGPGEKEAREAQDRIYSLEAKRQLAVVEQVSRFSGRWSAGIYQVSISVKGNSCAASDVTGSFAEIIRVVEWCKVDGEKLQMRVNGHRQDAPSRKFGGVCEFSAGSDSSRLLGRTISAWDDYRKDAPKFSPSCFELVRQR